MKQLTKKQRRKLLTMAAEKLQYTNDFCPIESIFSCLAVKRYAGLEMEMEYSLLVTPKNIGGQSEEKQLARQLAVLMFMEATS